MPERIETGTQSSWRRMVNKNLQYESIQLPESSSQQILHSHTLSNFLLRALPLCDEALQQNETLNLFKNEFAVFENDDLTIGNKAENNVKVRLDRFSLRIVCEADVLVSPFLFFFPLFLFTFFF